jgi:hypothetical protein
VQLRRAAHGVTAEQSLFGDTISGTSGTAYLPALEADHRVGSVLILIRLVLWATYRDVPPGAVP